MLIIRTEEILPRLIAQNFSRFFFFFILNVFGKVISFPNGFYCHFDAWISFHDMPGYGKVARCLCVTYQ